MQLSHRLFTSSNKVSSHNPAANVEILYILPSLRLSLYLTTHNINYTRAKMHTATHQPTTTAPQHLKDLEMGTPSRANSITNTASRDGATAGRGNSARLGTATDEIHKKRAKLTKTGAFWEWAGVRKNQYILLALATLTLGGLVALWISNC
jgi:hypothetical protein